MTQRRPISYLLEDVVVARARLSAARVRVGLSLSTNAVADLARHLAELKDAESRFVRDGGRVAVDSIDRAGARRGARELLLAEKLFGDGNCGCWRCREARRAA